MKYVVLLLFPLSLFAQKARNYTDVTTELSQKVVATVTGKSLHVGVVPFTATSTSVEKSAAFGEYLTETIIGQLGNQPDKIKIFERTRLDAILKEQQFILSDLMKPAAALKIGQFAPIDALLSGTYTKLKSYIDVSARLIDIASGEITVSYTGRIKMNKNLATLFGETLEDDGTSSGADPKTTATPQVNVTVNNNVNGSSSQPSRAELCRKKVEDFNAHLHDLSTPEKVSVVVSEGMKTPFDNECGKLHLNVMYSFTRYKIANPQYEEFLLKTLDTIAFPAGDDRALEIARYIASDGELNDREWNTAFHAISKVGNYSLSFFIATLLAKPTSPAIDITKERIAKYFDAAAAGKIGLPKAISYEAAFFAMLDGTKTNQLLREYVYQTFASRLNNDDRGKSTLFSALHNMYKEEKDYAQKTTVMKWIVEYVNANDYTKAADQLYDLAFDFSQTSSPTRNAEIERDYPAADLKLLVAGCKEKFGKYAMMSQYESQKEDRIDFCVLNGVPIAGVIPTMDEAIAVLNGANLDEQLRVVDMLSLMGDQPKKAESALVGLFSKRSLDDREKLSQIQTQAIVVLGNIKTSNAKAAEYMISVLPHYGNDTEAAMIALVKMGKPAVPSLVTKLEKTTEMEGGLQHQLITILGKIGKDAAPGIKAIAKVLNSTRNADIKYAAEAALQSITP